MLLSLPSPLLVSVGDSNMGESIEPLEVVLSH